MQSLAIDTLDVRHPASPCQLGLPSELAVDGCTLYWIELESLPTDN
jgi:hypothetical protein